MMGERKEKRERGKKEGCLRFGIFTTSSHYGKKVHIFHFRYYGCGLVIPECLENCWILDLGSGSGRDCYALSQLVGEKGHVTGIDMTQGQVRQRIGRLGGKQFPSHSFRDSYFLCDSSRIIQEGCHLVVIICASSASCLRG
jgi:SAM-dependent methyltransferase